MEAARPLLRGAPAGLGGRASQRPIFLPEKREAGGQDLQFGALGCRGHARGTLGLRREAEAQTPTLPRDADSYFSSFVMFG